MKMAGSKLVHAEFKDFSKINRDVLKTGNCYTFFAAKCTRSPQTHYYNRPLSANCRVNRGDFHKRTQTKLIINPVFCIRSQCFCSLFFKIRHLTPDGYILSCMAKIHLGKPTTDGCRGLSHRFPKRASLGEIEKTTSI